MIENNNYFTYESSKSTFYESVRDIKKEFSNIIQDSLMGKQNAKTRENLYCAIDIAKASICDTLKSRTKLSLKEIQEALSDLEVFLNTSMTSDIEKLDNRVIDKFAFDIRLLCNWQKLINKKPQGQ